MPSHEYELRYLRRFLSGAHRRGVARTPYVAIIATVDVSVDPLNPRRYRAGDERNAEAIERALIDGDDTATVVIKISGRRSSFLPRVDEAIANRDEWLDFWSDLLGVEVTEVHSWLVEPVRKIG